MKPNCTMVSWFTFPSVSTIDTADTSKVSQDYHVILIHLWYTFGCTIHTPLIHQDDTQVVMASYPEANPFCRGQTQPAPSVLGVSGKNRVRAEGDEDDNDLGDGWNPAALCERYTKPFKNDSIEDLSALLESSKDWTLPPSHCRWNLQFLFVHSGNQALNGGYPPWN